MTVEGSPPEGFKGSSVLCISLTLSCLSKKKNGGKEKQMKKRKRAREIILLWNLDSGARRPRSQSIWMV